MLKNYEESNSKQLFVDDPFINKYYRFTWDTFKNEKGFCLVIKIIFSSLLTFIYKTILLAYLLIISILEFMFSSFFNFVDLLSMGISIGMFCLWFYIIHLTNKIYCVQTPEIPESLHEYENLFVVNHLHILYNRYISWMAVNLFLIFIRLLRYFKFSRAISLVFNIFQKAKLTIGLYLIFLFIVNLGFVFFGYALFNENSITFRTIGNGILTLFVILAGKVYPQNTMYMEDDKWRPIFFFFFLSFNMLVLLNFFYSILIEGYSEAKERQAKNLGKDIHSNFFTNIYYIVIEKRKLFFEVCERYQQKIYQYIGIYFSHKTKMAIEIDTMIKDNAKMKNSKCCGNFAANIEIKESFYEIIYNISKKCLQINNFDDPVLEERKKRPPKKEEQIYASEEEDPLKLKELYLKEKYKKFLTEEVTIYHKIIIYIANLFNVELNFTKQKNSIVSKTTIFNALNDHLSNRRKSEKVVDIQSKDKWRCTFFTEYKKLIYSKATPYFKSNIFDKYYYYLNKDDIANKYYHNPKYYSDYHRFNPDRIPRFTKETTLEQNEILRKNDFFMIPSVLSKFNHDFHSTVPCPFNNACHTRESLCESCLELKTKYETLSSEIYDLMINNFYLPDFTNPDDKDLYLGHYLYETKKEDDKKIIANITDNFSKDVPNTKIEMFTDKILTHISQIPESFKGNCEDTTTASLYYYFFIWDTIYMILFEKNPKKVREIRNKSQSYKYVQEYLQEKVKNGTLFNYVYSNMNNLKGKQLGAEELKKYNLPQNYDFCDALRLIIRNEDLNGQKTIKIEDFDKSALFFFNNQKYFLNETEKLNEILMQERELNKFEQINFANYPAVFNKLWNYFPSDILFSLFFGYNCLINENKKKIVFKREIKDKSFMKKYNDSLDLFEFFLPEHRAEILSMLSPNKRFMTVAKLKIKKLYDDSNETAGIGKIQTFQDLLNHFKDYRVNLLIKHKFFFQVFDALFKDIKKGLVSINENMNLQYHKFLRLNNDNLTETEKIAMAKFYGHVIVKERYLFLREIFKVEMKKTALEQFQVENKENDVDFIQENIYQKVEDMEKQLEKEDKVRKFNKLDDKSFTIALKNNPFVWILSLDPFDYLDVCQKIKDWELREFYIELYIYLYGEQNDLKEDYYLKRKAKLYFIEKYDRYLEYVSKREKIEKQNEILMQRENELNDAVNYLTKRKAQYDELYANWLRQKKEFNSTLKDLKEDKK